MPILIRKIDELYGDFGNMSDHKIEFEGVRWCRSEHLFQALRFSSKEIRAEINAERNPFKAKLLAKRRLKDNPESVIVQPMSDADVKNMAIVLCLKVEQHPSVKKLLLDTRDEQIIEDCGKRRGKSADFWGARLENGAWRGANTLGRLWMELRNELKNIQ
jgi:ribA/ribD-fused uncharacterized protein